MASRHRVVWGLPRVGQLRCLKKDPSKVSFWVECYKRDNWEAGPFYVNLQNHTHYHYGRDFEGFIRRMITDKTSIYENALQYWVKDSIVNMRDIQRIELALDYLFVALGRLAERAVVS